MAMHATSSWLGRGPIKSPQILGCRKIAYKNTKFETRNPFFLNSEECLRSVFFGGKYALVLAVLFGNLVVTCMTQDTRLWIFPWISTKNLWI